MLRGKTLPDGGSLTRRKLIFTALALSGLLIALILLLTVGRPREGVVSVVSLRRDVPAGARLADEDLILVRLPARLSNDAYLTAVTPAIGQSPIHSLHAGQLLERGWLRERPSGISYPDAAANARLYTLRLQPEQANGFWLAAGNRVDVHLVARGGTGKQDAMLPDMLPAIRIAALIGGENESASPLQPISRQASDAPLVCLAVNAAEARILALAESACSIKLVPLNEPLSNASPGQPAGLADEPQPGPEGEAVGDSG